MMLYNPTRFKSENLEEVFRLMDENPLATVVTVAEGRPFISHLPLTPIMKDGEIELIGHLAKANPQWRSFSNSKISIVFQGPHAYITPRWYQEDDVPTWNYIVAHVSGTVEIIQDETGLIECLKTLSAHAEKHWPSGWKFFIPEDLSGENLTRSIVGFRVRIEEIGFKKKLTQSKTPEDRAGVMKGLQSRQDAGSLGILQQMQQMYHPNGEKK